MRSIFIVLSFLYSSFSYSQKMEVQINFYPSSGGQLVYSVDLSEDSLQVRDLGSRNNISGACYKRVLTAKELKRIDQAITQVRQREVTETEIILDSWRVEVLINGQKYYNESGVRLKTLPQDISDLLKLLLKRSKVKIDLYDFS